MTDARPPTPPTTDDQLRQATVGEPTRLDGPIRLAEYDPRWPQLFAREAQRIRTTLGDRAIRIEHVGSTAVSGLVAKPIIDIILVVTDSSDEPSYAPALEGAGYVLRIREPGWHEHRLFKGPVTAVNLHVFSFGSSEIEWTIALRDRLRSDPADRELYARAKRELASRTWRYVQNYADAKSEVIGEILSRAGATTTTG